MGSIDKDEEYAAVMLATPGMPDGKHEIDDGPPMTSEGPALIRSCASAVWRTLKSHDIRTGPRTRIYHEEQTLPVVGFNGTRFHLAWIRAIEAEHGPLLWALSAGELHNEVGDRGRFLAGYRGGKRVAMVAQFGFS